MTRTIRRYRRRYALLARLLAVVIAALALAWVVMIIWTRGGPQPLHRIVIAIPAPQMAATARHPA